MHEDTRIEYRLRIHGLPVRWKTRISTWNSPESFIDEQITGPYRVWIHEHRFTERHGGTFCEDSVRYAPRGGALVNTLFVRRDVRQIFSYRAERLKNIFAER